MLSHCPPVASQGNLTSLILVGQIIPYLAGALFRGRVKGDLSSYLQVPLQSNGIIGELETACQRDLEISGFHLFSPFGSSEILLERPHAAENKPDIITDAV